MKEYTSPNSFSASDIDILKTFVVQSDKLFDMGIIRSDSYTGEIGEYIASKIFSFERTERSSRSIDGLGVDGKRYQVKSKIVNKNNFSFQVRINKDEIDELIIVYFDNYYRPIRIIEIPSKELSDNKINISKRFFDQHNFTEYDSQTILSKVDQECVREIIKFGEIYQTLLEKGIVRSRRIVGDIGELYASFYMGLKLNRNMNEKGVDAYDDAGNTYEIKTRRVYESGRRKSDTRRLNGLKGKSADYLVVVALGKNFSCDGMWCMPMSNIKKPESATLRIVNNTENVRSIIPSKISWLK